MHGFWTTSFDLLRRLRRLFSFLIINIAELFRWSCGELNVFFLFLNGISSTCKRVPFSQKESSFSSAQVESLVLDTPMISLINQEFALTSCKDTRELIWGGLRLLSRIERTFPVGTKARVQLEAHLSLTPQDLDFLNDPEHSRSELTWTDYPHYIFFRKASCGGEIVTGHNSSTPPFKIAGFIRLSDVGSRGTYIRSKIIFPCGGPSCSTQNVVMYA